MTFPRRSGILLHPTSLPGPFGIGDLGPAAFRWIDALARSKQRLWQVLPLGPTGFGDSPYQSFSALAGNPYLVSPERLADDGLLGPGDLDAARLGEGPVDFGAVIDAKLRMLDRAYAAFRAAPGPLGSEYERFRAEHTGWLEDFALFMALKADQGGRAWTEWDAGLAQAEPQALAASRARLADAIDSQRFRQFLFFRQWHAVRDHARARGIAIVGDVPIFVSHDSADVWSHRGLFQLDDAGHPTSVAGVPPDYFSATGQLWGNPLYRWDMHDWSGYAWWIERLRATLEMVDVVRLDHFRGFEAHWEVPAGMPTAEKGRWVAGPGPKFLDAVRGAVGEVAIVAEDLGVITPEVEALRDAYDLPGMKVLEFAFGGTPKTMGAHPFLPHNYSKHCVVYTGTHDNDSARAWFDAAPPAERAFAMRYLECDAPGVPWAMIRAALSSVAHTAIVPLQDVLELGIEGRMNLPGRPSGNWAWRFRWDELDDWRLDRLANWSEVYGRVPVADEAEPGVEPAGSPAVEPGGSPA